jgi:hypothetical protein
MERVEEKRPVATWPLPAADGRQPPDQRGRQDGTLARTLSSRHVQAVAATLLYAAFACYLTWPLVTDLDTRIYGGVGDLTGAASTYRELVETGQDPFTAGELQDFNAPDGADIKWTLNIASFPAVGTLFVLSKVFGALPGISLFMLLGYTFSGLAMFLLVRRLTGHPGVAFFAGFAYAFYPFVVVKGQGHVDFVHGWALVVLLWRLLELTRNPTPRNGVWAGLALLLTFAWSPYFILFGGVTMLAVGAVAVAYAWRAGLLRRTVVAFAIAASIGLAWLGGVLLLDNAAPTSEIRTHTIEEAYAFSARAAEYVVPTAQHPLVGDAAGEYRSARLHGSNASENTLYVGISILLLAIAGFAASVRRSVPWRQLAFIAAAVVVLGFGFSSPPRVDLLGFNVPTPTDFLFGVTSTWRVFSRLVMVVMLGLVLLAALGLYWAVRGREWRVQGAVIALVLAVVAADLWARPPIPTNAIAAPSTYLRLAQLPRGITAEYPLLPAESSSYGDIFYQAWHDQPLLNGYPPGSPEENRALLLTDLSDPGTARGLSALGVRYVLVRQDLKAAGLPDPGVPTDDYKLTTRDDYIALYELRVVGRHVLVVPGDSFDSPESSPDGLYQWLLEDEGTIDVRGARCSPCTGTLRLVVASFDRPRVVTIRDPSGRVLMRRRVGEATTISLPVSFTRRVGLRISSDPGPQSVSEALGTGDTRSVSLAVSRPSFVPERGSSR